MDDILWAVRLIGLRNQASAAVEQGCELIWQAGEWTDGQMADEVRDGLAGDDDLAGDVEGSGGWVGLLSRKQGAGAEERDQQASDISVTGADHG